MRRGTVAACAALLAFVGSACSNDAVLTVTVEYESRTCRGLAQEFGRYLDEEVEHIEATGKGKYFAVTRPGQPKLLRQVLAPTEDDFSDRESLLLFAPTEHVKELGAAIRAVGLRCSLDELASGSEGEISEPVRSTLLADLNRRAEGSAVRTWRDWWKTWYALVSEPPGLSPS